jgi:hypothetical protein
VVPRGRTLGLLDGRSLEETSNLIAGPVGLGCRWLRHVAEKHGGGNNVLAGSVEDWGFARPVLDDATIDIASSLSLSLDPLCHVHALRTPTRRSAKVGAGTLVPHRAWPIVLESAQVALPGLLQGVGLRSVHQGAWREMVWRSLL